MSIVPGEGGPPFLTALLLNLLRRGDVRQAAGVLHLSRGVCRWVAFPEVLQVHVRIVRAGELDSRTAQTLGMQRKAAITTERTGAKQLWAGTVTIDTNAKTGAHHHGDLESVIYVVSGIARLRWGERLEFVAEANAGDFIYVPPYVPHQEINPSEDLQLHCVLARSGQRGLVVNLEITPVETPELVRWIDDLHK